MTNESEDMQPAGSDHGDPILLRRDIALLEAYDKWIRTMWAEDKDKNHHLPHYPDWVKSRLFWRIRSGKEPLKHKPPLCHSCPWYELIEVAGPHKVFSAPVCKREWEPGKTIVSVAQCRYDFIREEDGVFFIGFGPVYRFKAWNGTHKVDWRDGRKTTEPCGFIERIEDAPLCQG